MEPMEVSEYAGSESDVEDYFQAAVEAAAAAEAAAEAAADARVRVRF